MSPVAMPQLGESVAEGTVVRWLKRVGETVGVDEPLLEVASDKVSMEIPSLDAGVLREILVPEGATVAVGTVLARIEGVAGATVSGGASRTAEAASAASNGAVSNGSRAHLHSPVVRRLAREHEVDLSRLHGSGRGGRITRSDVLALVASEPPAAAPPAAAGHVFRTPFSTMRARIAENVMASKRVAADVFSVMEIDMENVHAARLARRDAFAAQEGTSLTYLPFIARASIDALRAFPAVNARIDGEALVLNASVHLGIAVDLDERGLMVPVIRAADGLNVTGIARAIAAVSASARAGTLGPAEASGSTFTITNNGAFGTLMTAPIINQPNVAILSTDAIEERVVPWQGMIAIRRRMYLCMSWDHRAFDGATAAKFLAHVKRGLEDRDWSDQF
jgi:pyruvate/2-oxoglutarate dehydrogenase complex dihydrolipoamide acyltransferase (E2) component